VVRLTQIARIVKTLWQTRGAAPGSAVVVQLASGGDQQRTAEFYQLPGIASGPTPQDRAVVVPTASGYRVVVASHNYRVNVEVSAGETIIYSTDADGGAKQAEIKLTTDGKIDLNGSSKTLVTHAELDTALQNLVTAFNAHVHTGVTTGPGSSGPPGTPATLDISAAEAASLRTDG
jgi:phage gp45-like